MINKMKVKVKKLVENAVVPRYAKSGDAGLALNGNEYRAKRR